MSKPTSRGSAGSIPPVAARTRSPGSSSASSNSRSLPGSVPSSTIRSVFPSMETRKLKAFPHPQLHSPPALLLSYAPLIQRSEVSLSRELAQPAPKFEKLSLRRRRIRHCTPSATSWSSATANSTAHPRRPAHRTPRRSRPRRRHAFLGLPHPAVSRSALPCPVTL